MKNDSLPIAIYYEHPDWFRPPFAELDRRPVEYTRIDTRRHSYDPGDTVRAYSLFFNHMSPSAYLRDNAHGIFARRRADAPCVGGQAVLTSECLCVMDQQ